MHHHHAAAAANGLSVRWVFLALVVVGTVIHLRDRSTRGASRRPGPGWGHALMGMAMASMLLPSHRVPVSPAAWQWAFGVIAACSVAGIGRAWRSGNRKGLLHHADLLVGATAMVVMGGTAPAAVVVSGALAAYFALHVVVAVTVGLWRMMVVDPDATVWASPAAVGVGGGVPVSTSTSALAARGMMAAAMAYMLAGR